MSKGYVCDCCGKAHGGEPTEWTSYKACDDSCWDAGNIIHVYVKIDKRTRENSTPSHNFADDMCEQCFIDTIHELSKHFTLMERGHSGGHNDHDLSDDQVSLAECDGKKE